jgi:hypothetical protein
MKDENQLSNSNIDFKTFLIFLKEIKSDLELGIFNQDVDYKIDAVALKLLQVDSKIDFVYSWLNSLFIEDKNKYERTCLVLNESINEIMEDLGHHKDWQPVTLDDEVLNEDDPFWYAILNKKIVDRLNTKESSLEFKECNKFFVFKLFSIKEYIEESKKTKNINTPTVDPLSFLRKEFISLFLSSEKKALGKKPNFSAMRCAAFCELLYEKKYFNSTKLKIKTLSAFALARYGLDIKNSLATSKKADRKNHQEKTVSNDIPLKKCLGY